jgi:hypothetical protein
MSLPVKHLHLRNQPLILLCLSLWLGIAALHGSDISQPQFQTKEDSLYFYWNKAKQQEDIQSQIDYMDALCVMYRYESSWKKHDSVTNELLELGLRENNRDAIAEAYNYMGISSALNGDNHGSIEYLQENTPNEH